MKKIDTKNASLMKTLEITPLPYRADSQEELTGILVKHIDNEKFKSTTS